jgi:hypothetical protein
MIHETTKLLRQSAMTWTAAACLPVPALLMTNPATNADVACLYLGLASAWLATEILRFGGYPDSRSTWLIKTTAIGVALLTNAAMFVAFGTMVSVRSNLPFPVLATFAIIPSIGLVPWLTLRLRDPFKAIVLSAFILMAAKLSACVVAKIVYGPDFMERGYIAADWRTAKLMISLTWSLITTISFGLLVLAYWQFEPQAIAVKRHKPLVE